MQPLRPVRRSLKFKCIRDAFCCLYGKGDERWSKCTPWLQTNVLEQALRCSAKFDAFMPFSRCCRSRDGQGAGNFC